MINYPTPHTAQTDSVAVTWPAPATVARRWQYLRIFAHALGEDLIDTLSELNGDYLDSYAAMLLQTAIHTGQTPETNVLEVVGSLPDYAELLPEADRMIEPSWLNSSLCKNVRSLDNARAIISPDTLAPMLWWSQQIIACADDIIAMTSWKKSHNAERARDWPEGTSRGIARAGEIVALYGGVLPAS